MYRVLLAALLMVPTVAFAQMPPKKYDHPFDGKLTITEVEYGTARAFCRKNYNSASMAKYGCATLYEDGSCHIVVSKQSSKNPGYRKSQVLRHEIGHCNGWPANHPNAR